VIEGDREVAEMLHLFFALMELDCVVVAPGDNALTLLRELQPDVLLLDFDLPDRRALEIARALGSTPAIFLTRGEPSLAAVPGPVLRKPDGAIEELLGLFEVVLDPSR
jgi:DNA-binding response OmpR family regulator